MPTKSLRFNLEGHNWNTFKLNSLKGMKMLQNCSLFIVFLALKTCLKMAVFKGSIFQHRIKENNITFILKTKNGNSSRLFRLENGKLSSRKYSSGNVDFSIEWRGNLISEVFKKKLQLNIHEFFRNESIKFSGDLSQLLWLVSVLGEMRQSLVGKRQQMV